MLRPLVQTTSPYPTGIHHHHLPLPLQWMSRHHPTLRHSSTPRCPSLHRHSRPQSLHIRSHQCGAHRDPYRRHSLRAHRLPFRAIPLSHLTQRSNAGSLLTRRQAQASFSSVAAPWIDRQPLCGTLVQRATSLAGTSPRFRRFNLGPNVPGELA